MTVVVRMLNIQGLRGMSEDVKRLLQMNLSIRTKSKKKGKLNSKGWQIKYRYTVEYLREMWPSVVIIMIQNKYQFNDHSIRIENDEFYELFDKVLIKIGDTRELSGESEKI